MANLGMDPRQEMFVTRMTRDYLRGEREEEAWFPDARPVPFEFVRFRLTAPLAAGGSAAAARLEDDGTGTYSATSDTLTVRDTTGYRTGIVGDNGWAIHPHDRDIYEIVEIGGENDPAGPISGTTTTTLTGILMGSGGVVTTATPGTDYQAVLWDRTSTTLNPHTATDAVEWTSFLRYQDATTGGTSCTIIGLSAGTAASGSRNSAVGNTAGTALTAAATDDTFLGFQAGRGVSSARYSVYVGAYAGNGTYASITGDNNIGIGYYSCSRMTSGNGNVGIGSSTLLICSTGTDNMAIGNQSCYQLTTGTQNVGLGYRSLYACVGGGGSLGSYNMAIGGNAVWQLTDGYWNVGVGNSSLYSEVHGQGSVAIGHTAGYKSAHPVTDANYHGMCVYIGYAAGHENVTGDGTVCLGPYAGYYETAANKLFIDNAQRDSESDGRAKALLYGVFAAATASQYFTVNGHFTVREQILDTAVTPKDSLDTNLRLLYDTTGTMSADWSGRGLVAADGAITVLNWNDNKCYDTDGDLAIDWQSRILADADGASVADWNTASKFKVLNLTQTRITFAGADKELTDSSELTWASSTLTTGGLKNNKARAKHRVKITNTDSPYTVLATDHIILADCTSGNITINLPAIADGQRELVIKRIDTSANSLTLDGSGTEKIESFPSGTTEELTETVGIRCCVTLLDSDSLWRVINFYQNT